MNDNTLGTDKTVANAFVTFHVQNAEVLSNVQTIRRELLQFDPDFSHTFQPLQSLHVTLLLIHLSKENFQNACDALAATVQHVQREFHHRQPPLNILPTFIASFCEKAHFNGVAHNGKVSMYAKIEQQSAEEWCNKTHSIAVDQFQSRGIPSLNPFHESHFVPHATILYLRHESDRKLIKWWADEEAKWEGRKLGTETVKVLQLCNIDLDEQTQDYKVLYEVPIK